MKIGIWSLVGLLLVGPAMAQSADRIIEKNLFDPARGTQEEAPVKGPVEEELPKEIPILDGIVTIGNYQRAIFRAKDKKTRRLESVVVKPGDTVAGAKVEKLEPDAVMIVFGGKRYRLTVDSKHDMKNVPRTSGGHKGIPTRKPTGKQVVARKPATATRKTTPARRGAERRTPAVRPGSKPGHRSGAHSTPFGWTGGKKPAKTRKKPISRNRTPF